MDRRALLAGAGALLAAPLAAEAQRVDRIYRIGVLGVMPTPRLEDAYRNELRDLGWIEGQNIRFESRYYEQRLERLPGLAAELVRLNVDLILAWTAPETAAARMATKTIPIVFASHGDPIVSGDVISLARPGWNATGLTLMLPELAAKRLELFRQVFTGLSRVDVLWNAMSRVKAVEWGRMQSAARTLGVSLKSREFRDANDLDGLFAEISRIRPQALMTLEDPVLWANRARVTEFAVRERLPTMHGLRDFVEAGGLMGYGVDLVDCYRRSARYIDQILRGARPADLPVQQATKFELVINLRTAKALGLTIPPALLLPADQVIE
jgi:putative tryptophan/tyrosine transport system substrate-binding protein